MNENTILEGIMPSLNFPEITIPPLPILASEFQKRLVNRINEFNKKLDEKHEVGARLVNFGQAYTFHIDDISYSNPSLISFMGKNLDGDPVELVQHVSQISILLVAMKRIDTTGPKRPIGFANWEEYENQKS